MWKLWRKGSESDDSEREVKAASGDAAVNGMPRKAAADDDDDVVARERRLDLTGDLAADGGGQNSEVGNPYEGTGEVQRGERDAYLKPE